MSKKMSYIGLFINLVIVILEIIGFVMVTRNFGSGIFEYYTQDSNLLLLVSSLIYSIYIFMGIRRGRIEIPNWLGVLKYMAVVSVSITFIVVITILSWSMEGGLYGMLFEGAMLYHHTICPILAVISFILFENYDIDGNIQIIRSLYFTFIYSIILISLNIVKLVEGPYPFLMVHNQSIFMSLFWIVIILSGAFGISMGLRFLNRKFNLVRK